MTSWLEFTSTDTGTHACTGPHVRAYISCIFLDSSQNPRSRSRATSLVLVTIEVLAPSPHSSQFLSGSQHGCFFFSFFCRLCILNCLWGGRGNDGHTSLGICCNTLQAIQSGFLSLTAQLCRTHNAHLGAVISRQSSAWVTSCTLIPRLI